MSNIPRRKIYEVMLEYEEFVLEIQILILSDENFEKYKEQYKNSVKNAYEKYKIIKALIMMFLENQKFEKEEDFQNVLNHYIQKEKETNKYLKQNKNLPKHIKDLLETLDEKFQNPTIKTRDEGEKIFFYLDKFNSIIPKILEIKRDEMKQN